MSPERRCNQCGTPLTVVSDADLCPACLLEAGLGETAVGKPATNPAGLRADDSGPLTRRFGNYKLLEEIARSGVGVVYRARQLGLDRVVAVKLLLSGPLAGPDLVQRFRTEAAAAASLQHPNIVAIHEVGFCDGQHFIAMDYIAGRSLADIIRDGPLEARRAAAYVKTVAEAIHFAHERQILHRDLKPSNVLVDQFDAPRVTDFGLARRLDAETVLTLSGQVLGSPSYMAPEQAAGRHRQVSRRTDVYALGAILYHLLTGRPPFAADSVPATLHAVLETDVVAPRLLRAGLPRDLETICLKCVEKEPTRRYATAQELAEDLGRFLGNEPVRAQPVTVAGRAWRWARRKPAMATLIVLVHLVAAAGLAGILWQWRQAARHALEARAQRDVAEGRLYAAQMRLAHADFQAGRLGSARERLRAWESVGDRAGRPDWRGFEWRWLQRLCAASPGEVIATNAVGFTAAAVSPDGRLLALGAADGTIRVVDLSTGTTRTSWRAHSADIEGLEFIPGHAQWLVSVGGDDERLKIWDLQQARLLTETNCSRGLLAHVAVSRTGRFLAAGASESYAVNVWELTADPATGLPRLRLHRTLAGGGPSAFSPDERTLAVANYPELQLALWDLTRDAPPELLAPGHKGFAEAIACSKDGQWVAVGSGDQEVLIWRLSHPRERVRRRAINGEARALCFSTDGRRLFAATRDQNLQTWDQAGPDEPLVLRGHSDGVNALALVGAEPLLISASRDGTARRWRTDPAALAQAAQLPTEYQTLKASGPDESGLRLAASRDQHLVVGFGRGLRVFDQVRGQVVTNLDWTNLFTTQVLWSLAPAFSPDGTRLALGGNDPAGRGGWVAVLDAQTLKPVTEPLQIHKVGLGRLAFALEGRVLVSGGGSLGGSGDGEVVLTDVETWQIRRRISTAGNLPVEPFAVSADGRRLAVVSRQDGLIVEEIESGHRLARCPHTLRFVSAVAIAPPDAEGEWVAFSDDTGALFLWDWTGRRPLRRRTGHQGEVISLAFSPDGRTLASGSMDHTIRLWHPDLDQPVAVLTGHTSWIFDLTFAAHGEALVAVGLHGGAVLVWHAAAVTGPTSETKQVGRKSL